MNEDINEWWVALGREGQAEIYEQQNLWHDLPPLLRMYYNYQGWYFMRRKFVSLLLALTIVVIGVASYILEQNLLLSFGLIIVGIIVGVVMTWEVESK